MNKVREAELAQMILARYKSEWHECDLEIDEDSKYEDFTEARLAYSRLNEKTLSNDEFQALLDIVPETPALDLLEDALSWWSHAVGGRGNDEQDNYSRIAALCADMRDGNKV